MEASHSGLVHHNSNQCTQERSDCNVHCNPAYSGGVAERSNALAWKAGIPKGIAGSNPVSSAMCGRKCAGRR